MLRCRIIARLRLRTHFAWDRESAENGVVAAQHRSEAAPVLGRIAMGIFPWHAVFTQSTINLLLLPIPAVISKVDEQSPANPRRTGPLTPGKHRFVVRFTTDVDPSSRHERALEIDAEPCVSSRRSAAPSPLREPVRAQSRRQCADRAGRAAADRRRESRCENAAGRICFGVAPAPLRAAPGS